MISPPPLSSLHSLFEAQCSASRAQAEVLLALRRERLLKIRMLLQSHGAALADAVQADFGVRSQQLTEISDLFVLRTLLAGLLKNLARWMKPVRVRTPLQPPLPACRSTTFFSPARRRWAARWPQRPPPT